MAKIQEVPTIDLGIDSEPLEQVQYDTRYNVFANEIQESKQSKSISNTCVVETECDDEHVALANLIANLKHDVDENKKIQKQLKKANTSLTQELKECKSTLEETSRTLGESNIDYDKLERKLNETLGLLAQKDIDIKEGLKVKAYEISVVKKKHNELVKQSLLTKSHYEGLVREKTKIVQLILNPLFAKDNQEQKYLKQPKIINNIISDDQIDSNIIFDELNVNVNNSSVDDDNNAQKSYEFEQLARNAYGYIRNHMKTVKNGQARTRESEEYKKKPKNQSRSQKSQASVKSSQRKVNSWSTEVNHYKTKPHNNPIPVLQLSQKAKNNPSSLIGP
ncbi:hypothetical protein Tco_1076675 [Tanacetum coccineum]